MTRKILLVLLALALLMSLTIPAAAETVSADDISAVDDGAFDYLSPLWICLAIGAVVGLITALVLKGQLKTVRKQNQANNYIKPDSMQLTVCNDIYLYRNVTRTKKASSSSSDS